MKLNHALWIILFGAIVFMTAFLSHLPASFVFQQLNLNLPPGLVVKNVEGTAWQGRASLAWHEQDGGNLNWRVRPLYLLLGDLSAGLDWHYREQTLSADLTLDQQNIAIKIDQGQLDLAVLSAPLVKTFFVLNGLQGQLIFRDFAFQFDQHQAWLSALSGQLVLTDLALMGVVISQLDITPTMQAQKIQLALSASDQGWVLQGSTQLTAPNLYHTQLDVKADNTQTMPDWAKMLLHQTSPTQAKADFKGTW